MFVADDYKGISKNVRNKWIPVSPDPVSLPTPHPSSDYDLTPEGLDFWMAVWIELQEEAKKQGREL